MLALTGFREACERARGKRRVLTTICPLLNILRPSKQLQHKIERNEAAFQLNPAVDDVYAVASLLKVRIRHT